MGLERDLAKLHEFERRLSEFYGWLAEIFTSEPQAAAIFRRLRSEEMGHANAIQFKLRILRQNPSLFEGLSLGDFDVEGTLEGADILRRAASPPPLSEAVRTAAAIEMGAAERHGRLALQVSDERAAALLRTLTDGDRNHARDLIAFGLERGYLNP